MMLLFDGETSEAGGRLPGVLLLKLIQLMTVFRGQGNPRRHADSLARRTTRAVTLEIHSARPQPFCAS